MLCRSHAVHSDYLVVVEVADGRSGVHSGYQVAVIAVILVRFSGCIATAALSSERATFALNLFCRSSRLGLWCWVRVAPCLCCACLCFCFRFALVRPHARVDVAAVVFFSAAATWSLADTSSSLQRLPGRWRILSSPTSQRLPGRSRILPVDALPPWLHPPLLATIVRMYLSFTGIVSWCSVVEVPLRVFLLFVCVLGIPRVIRELLVSPLYPCSGLSFGLSS
jgi:hypothetical protein